MVLEGLVADREVELVDTSRQRIFEQVLNQHLPRRALSERWLE
jgi:hypothetical protein